MAKGEPLGVKAQALDAFAALPGERAVELEVAVLLVADHRMARMGEVHADLMGPPREEAKLEQAEGFARPEEAHLGPGGLPAGMDRHAPLPRAGHVLVQRRFDKGAPAGPPSLHYGEIALVDFPLTQHAVELGERAALPGEDEEARGIAVEPVRKLEKALLRALGAQRLDDAMADTAAAVYRHP